jgi:hypothetical protein
MRFEVWRVRAIYFVALDAIDRGSAFWLHKSVLGTAPTGKGIATLTLSSVFFGAPNVSGNAFIVKCHLDRA